MAAKPQIKASPDGAADPPLWRCPDCRRQFANRNHLHAFRFTRVGEIDDQVAARFAEAYRVGEQRHLASH
jgi:hypothetical protein